MTLNLNGKSAVVTGGARGIGLAIVKRLHEAGAAVAFCSKTEASVAKALERLGGAGATIAGRAADVSDLKSVTDFFAFAERELGGIDILVNNAGIGAFSDLATMPPETWHELIGTNLTGVYNCLHTALPLLKKRGGGFIVNISSLAGKNAFAGGAAYNASKFGLNGLSEAIMLDHRYDNIRVSYIMPGSVSTEFRNGGEADWKIAPEDVAEAVAMVLAMPERTMISRVEIRPSRPPKR